MSQLSKLTIQDIKEVCQETFEVVFARPVNFDFKAGQYSQFKLKELTHSDTKGASRVFSIASSPSDKDKVSILFRNSGSGYKKTLLSLTAGGEVFAEDPAGSFVLPHKGEHIFVAGGVGISPFMSLLREMGSSNMADLDIKLIYSNRNADSAPHTRELSLLANTLSNIDITHIFGRIESDTLAGFARSSAGKQWWVVGPPPMVADIRQKLHLVGVSDANVHCEEFVGY